MKKLLTLIVIASLASCSSDDNNGNGGPKKYVTDMIVVQNGDTDTYHFEYDANKNITAIERNGDPEFTFTYEGNTIQSVVTNPETGEGIQFVSSGGRITGYTGVLGEDLSPVSYEPQNNRYTFSEDAIQVTLADRDIARIDYYDRQYFSMNYANAKGPLYSVPTENIFVMTLFTSFYPFLFTRPATSFQYDEVGFTCTNTYDSDNYLTKMILEADQGSLYSITYVYSEM